MGLKIVYSKIALQDAAAIYNYISRDSVYYAKREIKLIKVAIKKLKLQPLLGKKFEKSEDENTRELIFRNYRIIYDIVTNRQITILSIHHHSRLLANTLLLTTKSNILHSFNNERKNHLKTPTAYRPAVG